MVAQRAPGVSHYYWRKFPVNVNQSRLIAQDNDGRCIEASETGDVYSKECDGASKQEWVLTEYNATGSGISSVRQCKQLTSNRINASDCLGFHHDHPLGVQHTGSGKMAPFSYRIQLQTDTRQCLGVAQGPSKQAPMSKSVRKRELSVQVAHRPPCSSHTLTSRLLRHIPSQMILPPSLSRSPLSSRRRYAVALPLSTQSSIPSTKHSTLNTKHSTLNTKHSTLDIKH